MVIDNQPAIVATIKHRERDGLPVADGSWNGNHLSIFPSPYGVGYEVHITKEKPEGGPDFSQNLNSIVIDAGADDVPEVADTYMRRLVSGMKPEDMFRDIEEASLSSMQQLFESTKKK